jgi:hypothetical protein
MTFGLTTAGMIVVGGMAAASAASAGLQAKQAADKKTHAANVAISSAQGGSITALANIHTLNTLGINQMREDRHKTATNLATVEAKYLSKVSGLLAGKTGMVAGQAALMTYTNLAFNKKQAAMNEVIVAGESNQSKIADNLYKHQRTAQSEMNRNHTNALAAASTIPNSINVAMDVGSAVVGGAVDGGMTGLSLAGSLNKGGSFKGEMFNKATV